MDNISFRTTVLPLGDRLYRLALRITMNRAEAEDVVQDTLLKVWEHRSEWEQIGNLEAYAIATCRNRAIDVTKRLGRNTKSLDEAIKVEGSSLRSGAGGARVQEFKSSLEARERLSLVRRLMDSLPEVQRTIMLLRDIEGRTYQEIAQVLDISETQVKVYLHRARIKVKNGIKDSL